MKKKKKLPRILYSVKLSFIKEGEIKAFPGKQKLRDFITSRPPLQESHSDWNQRALDSEMRNTWNKKHW